eukprot:7048179-Pyramimonas_sp.AAC.1
MITFSNAIEDHMCCVTKEEDGEDGRGGGEGGGWWRGGVRTTESAPWLKTTLFPKMPCEHRSLIPVAA